MFKLLRIGLRAMLTTAKLYWSCPLQCGMFARHSVALYIIEDSLKTLKQRAATKGQLDVAARLTNTSNVLADLLCEIESDDRLS